MEDKASDARVWANAKKQRNLSLHNRAAQDGLR